jgi:hypothetical protein
LSNKKLQAMLWNWEIPLPMEAHAVRYCAKIAALHSSRCMIANQNNNLIFKIATN